MIRVNCQLGILTAMMYVIEHHRLFKISLHGEGQSVIQ